jgi:hypothetical protein
MGKAARRKKYRPTSHPTTFPLDTTPHQAKLSTRLCELIAPYIAPEYTYEDYKTIVGLAALAWNLSRLEQTERQHAINAAVMLAAAGGYGLPRVSLETLIERKLRLFSDDIRPVEEFDVIKESESRFTVTAVTSIDI